MGRAGGACGRATRAGGAEEAMALPQPKVRPEESRRLSCDLSPGASRLYNPDGSRIAGRRVPPALYRSTTSFCPAPLLPGSFPSHPARPLSRRAPCEDLLADLAESFQLFFSRYPGGCRLGCRPALRAVRAVGRLYADIPIPHVLHSTPSPPFLSPCLRACC
ncbi:hypothetical protein DFH06DRAFT_1204135 [Mycena polygramma]|nr:hypothetical protein DFH06DRAFT_1204135 [Mycena polygramma]